MTSRERTAWLMAVILAAAYGWYMLRILAMRDGGSLTDVPYQQAAIVALIIVVVQAALSHAVVAATMPAERVKRGLEKVIARRAGHIRGVVIGVGAVLAMVLAMVDADPFWIANVLLAALVTGELALFGVQILQYRAKEGLAGVPVHLANLTRNKGESL